MEVTLMPMSDLVDDEEDYLSIDLPLRISNRNGSGLLKPSKRLLNKFGQGIDRLKEDLAGKKPREALRHVLFHSKRGLNTKKVDDLHRLQKAIEDLLGVENGRGRKFLKPIEPKLCEIERQKKELELRLIGKDIVIKDLDSEIRKLRLVIIELRRRGSQDSEMTSDQLSQGSHAPAESVQRVESSAILQQVQAPDMRSENPILASPEFPTGDDNTLTRSPSSLSFSNPEKEASDYNSDSSAEDESSNGSYPGSDELASSEQRNEHVKLSMFSFKQILVDQIMNDFWIMFDKGWTPNITSRGCRGSASSESSANGTFLGNASLSTSSTQKRQRDAKDGQESDGSDERGPPKRPASQSLTKKEYHDRSKFACPYRKHDPSTYNIHGSRSCALSSFDTVARVKEHIYRRHRIPTHCTRCWLVFENKESLDSHWRQVDSCGLQPSKDLQGITTEIEKQLRSRKKAYQDQSECERWKDIYRLLFPGEIVPSPCFEPIRDEAASSPDIDHLEEYERFSRRELPLVVRNHLEALVDNELLSLDESLKRRLVSVVQICQEEILETFRIRQATTTYSTTKIGPFGSNHDAAAQRYKVQSHPSHSGLSLPLLPAPKSHPEQGPDLSSVVPTDRVSNVPEIIVSGVSEENNTIRTASAPATNFGSWAEVSSISEEKALEIEFDGCLDENQLLDSTFEDEWQMSLSNWDQARE